MITAFIPGSVWDGGATGCSEISLPRLAGKGKCLERVDLDSSSSTALAGLNLTVPFPWQWNCQECDRKTGWKATKTSCYHMTSNCRTNNYWEVIITQIRHMVEKTASNKHSYYTEYIHWKKERKFPKAMVFLLRTGIFKSPMSGPLTQSNWIRKVQDSWISQSSHEILMCSQEITTSTYYSLNPRPQARVSVQRHHEGQEAKQVNHPII